jgi:hypothetical protein
MTIVHYYLGRPARVWIAANARRSPGQPARGSTPSVPAAAHGSADARPSRVGHRKPSVTAASGLPALPVAM